MDFVTFAICITVIVGLVLHAYHVTQEKANARHEEMYSKALGFQESVLREIRLIRAQEQVERAQMVTERTNLMGTFSYLIGELRCDRNKQDEEMNMLVERLRIDLVTCVADAAAHAMGQVKGESVSVRKDVQGASSEDAR